MTRLLYQILLRLHPEHFRARYGAEMSLAFDDSLQTMGAPALLADVMGSLIRQRLLRQYRKRQRAPQAKPAAVLASWAVLNSSSHHSLYRLFRGAAASSALFVLVYFCLAGRKAFRRDGLLNEEEGSVHGKLTSADLATIQSECIGVSATGCLDERVRPVKPEDEMTDFSLPTAADTANSHELLLPTGPRPIGRILYHWPQPIPGSKRMQNRVAFVWYPALQTRRFFKSVWDYSLFHTLLVQTHTLEGPPVTSGKNLYPVLLFYPATNSSSAAYTTQIENLVSHGYVVASLEPRTDSSVIPFPSSPLLPFATAVRRVAGARTDGTGDGLVTKAISSIAEQDKIGAGDLSFLLDRVEELNQESWRDVPFAGRLDLNHVGAFGHAAGGGAAAAACGLDQRISACLNEDGWTPGGPAATIGTSNPPQKPFMWINIPLAPLEDTQLAYLRFSRRNFDALAVRSAELGDLALAKGQGNSHRITLRFPGISDENFTDGPFVWSMVQPVRDIAARNALVIVNTYSRAFFDQYVKRVRSQLLDGSTLPYRNVEVKGFARQAVQKPL